MSGRKRKKRNVSKNYDTYFFRCDKQKGLKKEVLITDEELEALNLSFVSGQEQKDAADKMGISQSQFQRDVNAALVKITNALTNGHSIRIIKT